MNAPAHLAISLGTTPEWTRSLSLFHLVKHFEWDKRSLASCWALWVLMLFMYCFSLLHLKHIFYPGGIQQQAGELKEKDRRLTLISFLSWRMPFLRVRSLRWLPFSESSPAQLSKEHNKARCFGGLMLHPHVHVQQRVTWGHGEWAQPLKARVGSPPVYRRCARGESC